MEVIGYVSLYAGTAMYNRYLCKWSALVSIGCHRRYRYRYRYRYYRCWCC
jgi:hypothetical protein